MNQSQGILMEEVSHVCNPLVNSEELSNKQKRSARIIIKVIS